MRTLVLNEFDFKKLPTSCVVEIQVLNTDRLVQCLMEDDPVYHPTDFYVDDALHHQFPRTMRNVRANRDADLTLRPGDQVYLVQFADDASRGTHANMDSLRVVRIFLLEAIGSFIVPDAP